MGGSSAAGTERLVRCSRRSIQNANVPGSVRVMSVAGQWRHRCLRWPALVLLSLFTALGAGSAIHAPVAAAAQPTPACRGADLQVVVGQWIGATMHAVTHLYIRNAGSGACTILALPAARISDDTSGDVLWSRAAQAGEAVLQPGAVGVSFMQATNYCGPHGARTFTVTLDFGRGSGVIAVPAGSGPSGAACYIPDGLPLDFLILRVTPQDHPFAFPPPYSQPLGRLIMPGTGAGPVAASRRGPTPAAVWLVALLLCGIGAAWVRRGSREAM